MATCWRSRATAPTTKARSTTCSRCSTQAVEDFAIIVQRSSHDGYRVSALRGLVETALTRLHVLRAAGRAPRSLAGPTVAQEMQVVFREFAELLRQHDVSDDVLRDLLELAESKADQSSRGGHALIAVADRDNGR
jgi:hypothetical protein